MIHDFHDSLCQEYPSIYFLLTNHVSFKGLVGEKPDRLFLVVIVIVTNVDLYGDLRFKKKNRSKIMNLIKSRSN